MHYYSAYGLGIRSALLLPELTSGVASKTESGEVSIRFGQVGSPPAQLDPAGFGFWAAGDEACHFLETVGAFLVRGGREIVVDPAPGVEERLLRLSLLGPAFALLLHQRGFLVMHASVVAHGDTAVAILGKSGWGKSTIAGALYAKGYDLVADDVAAVQMDQEGASVLPGFPQVKLWPEAAALLGEVPERLPLLHPNFDKRAWRTSRGFSLGPRRLKRIYVLATGPASAIAPLKPREACFELLGHWYGHRFGEGLLHGDSAALHLRQCTQLASRVSTHRLYRSGGAAALLRLADRVDEDLRGRVGESARMKSTAR